MRWCRALLLAACASAVEHPELEVFKDTSGGSHYRSSLDYFASALEGRDLGFVAPAETVLELYGGIDETATVVGPFFNHYAGPANHADGLDRGIRIAARDWSTGVMSIATDLEDAFDAAEDQSRASEYSITTQTTVALCEDYEIIDRVAGAAVPGSLLRELVRYDREGRLRYVYDAAEAVMVLIMLALTIHFSGGVDSAPYGTPVLELVYNGWCFFGQLCWKAAQNRFLGFWRRRRFRNFRAIFCLKSRMHMALQEFGAKMCACLGVMQGQSTTPIDVSAKRDSLWPADEPDMPCPRDRGGLVAPGGRTQHRMLRAVRALRADDVMRALRADEADGENDGDAPPLPQPQALPTVAASSILAVVPGAQSSLLRRAPRKMQALIDDAEATPHYDVDSERYLLEQRHLDHLGVDDDEVPRDRLKFVRQLTAKRDSIASLVTNGFSGLVAASHYALVIWLGSADYYNTWFPPMALFDVLRPFQAHYYSSLLMTLASYFIIRETALHAVFCLALTCREAWRGRRRCVDAHGRFVLSGEDAIVLFAPAVKYIVWYILFYYWWLLWFWPILIYTFGFRVALYKVNYGTDGKPDTGELVAGSGAFRDNACDHTPSTFPLKVWFKNSVQEYEDSSNFHTDPVTGEVLDVLNGAVLLPFIREDWNPHGRTDGNPGELARQARAYYS